MDNDAHHISSIAVDDLWQEFRPRNAHGTRRRGEVKWALKGISFDVGMGQMFGLIGQNGSGKTTLLKTLAGVLKPSKGYVRTEGRVSSLIDLSAGINRDLTGRENIMLGGVLLGMSRAEVRNKYPAIVDFCELSTTVLDQPLTSYSSGMGLRIAFSVIACSEPSVLLIDEVLAVGDEAFQQKCIAQVEEFKRAGASIVVASHDLDLIVSTTDTAMALKGGECVFHGDPEEAVAAYRIALREDLEEPEGSA